MNKYIINNKSINSLANLFVFLCVFVIDAMSLPLSQGVKVALLTIVCAGVVIWDLGKRNYIEKKEFFWVICPSVLLIITQILSKDLALSYESKILMMYAGYIITRRVPFDIFREKYLQIMYVICIISLVCWLLGLLGIPIWNWLPSSGAGQYKTLFFYAFDIYKGYISERNNGPFWEPGVFQIYINIALIFLLFNKKKLNIKYLFVYLFALITTISTTGYVSFAIIALAYIYDKGKYIKFHHVLIILGLFLGAFYYISSNEELYLRLFGKFEEGSSNNASFVIRVNEIAFYYEAWTSNFMSMLMGIGSTAAYEYATKLHSIADVKFEGSTLTTMREFASFGLLFTMTRLALMFKFFKTISEKTISSILLFIVLLLCLNTESMVYSMIFCSLFYYGIVNNNHQNRRMIMKQ